MQTAKLDSAEKVSSVIGRAGCLITAAPGDEGGYQLTAIIAIIAIQRLRQLCLPARFHLVNCPDAHQLRFPCDDDALDIDALRENVLPFPRLSCAFYF